MNAAAPAIFLLARLLLMSDAGTELISEHRASVPAGGTGLVMETLRLEGLPEALHIYLSPRRLPVPAGGEGGEGAAELEVGIRAEIWDLASQAAAGRPPRETNRESVQISAAGSRLVQVAESAAGDRRLFLSLSSPPPPVEAPAPALPGIRPAARPVAFRIEAYRGSGGARELLQRHLLTTVEHSPVSWESRWKRPLPGGEGRSAIYRDEGLTLRLLPVVTKSGWISVEADLSALLYAEGETEPLSLSSRVTRTLPLGIPFEVSLELPDEEKPEAAEGEAGQGERPRPAIIVEVTPYRPVG